jgi:hypothetical protein
VPIHDQAALDLSDSYNQILTTLTPRFLMSRNYLSSLQVDTAGTNDIGGRRFKKFGLRAALI